VAKRKKQQRIDTVAMDTPIYRMQCSQFI